MATVSPDYYARRAKKERAMADAAKDPAARRAHAQMAERYERRADGGELRSMLVERG